MKRFSIIILVLLSAIFLVSMVSADGGGGGSHQNFVGLWEGVDPNDGSRRTVSISDNDRDGVYDVFQFDTYWSLCGDDSAVTTGSATLGNDGILHFQGSLTCRSTGASIPSFAVDYQLVRPSNTLIESPIGVPLAPATLHQVSTR
jgi:hypothetical protein